MSAFLGVLAVLAALLTMHVVAGPGLAAAAVPPPAVAVDRSDPVPETVQKDAVAERTGALFSEGDKAAAGERCDPDCRAAQIMLGALCAAGTLAVLAAVLLPKPSSGAPPMASAPAEITRRGSAADPAARPATHLMLCISRT